MPNSIDPWEQIISLTKELGELKGKVDSMDRHVTTQLTHLRTDIQLMTKNFEERINTNEDNIANMKGKAGGIALAVSMIIGLGGFLINFISNLY